jgi:hypothetical protein
MMQPGAGARHGLGRQETLPGSSVFRKEYQGMGRIISPAGAIALVRAETRCTLEERTKSTSRLKSPNKCRRRQISGLHPLEICNQKMEVGRVGMGIGRE